MQTSDEILSSPARQRRSCVYAVFINLLTTLFLYGVSPAAVMPEYERLAPLSDAINGPLAVASDREGRLYVAETGSGSVQVLSRSGRHLAALTGLDTPISVAADADGRILVGSREKGSVQIYDADFTPMFKLGSGDGEFSRPNDIRTDAGGRIYVVDRGNDIVRMYESSGQFTGTLGSPGNNTGQFHRPVSLAIDEAAGEILVLDRQLVPGTAKQGARIQFFTLAGDYLRGFTRNGGQAGGMVTPQGITVDGESRIYVTDSYQNAVLVYDNTGVFLGAVHDLGNPLRAPLGVTIDGTNRLSVVSRMADSIDVYGIDRYAGLDEAPAELRFTAGPGGPDPAPREITVRNSGTVAVTWEAASNMDWLMLSGGSGVLEPGRLTTVAVTVNVAGCAPGEYRGTIIISADPGLREIVPVVLTVEPSAILAVTPAGLAFIAEAGSLPAPETVTIANLGSAAMNWTASADRPWIRLSALSGICSGSGTGPATITVSADATALAAGTYSGTITVSGGNALASPAVVDVTLTLTESAKPPGGGTGHDFSPPGTVQEENLSQKWLKVSQMQGVSLNGIWGSSSSDIFAVGDAGVILHYDGTTWDRISTGISSNLNGVWGTSAASVYIIGDDGVFLHYDGKCLTDISSSFRGILRDVWCGPESAQCFAVGQNGGIFGINGVGKPLSVNIAGENIVSLNDIWGSSESDIFAVGDAGTLLRYDGSTWTQIPTDLAGNLYGVWGSTADNVFAVGLHGTVLHYDGTAWTKMHSGTRATLLGIWGNSADEVYAVGESGTMLLFQDSHWHRLDTGIAEGLNDAWGGRRKEVYVVGSNGSIFVGRAPFPWRLLFPVIMQNGQQ